MKNIYPCYTLCGNYKLFDCEEVNNRIYIKNGDFIQDKINCFEIDEEKLNSDIYKTIRSYFDESDISNRLHTDIELKEIFLAEMQEIYKVNPVKGQ